MLERKIGRIGRECILFLFTVKPVLKANCIKQSPVFKGHFLKSHKRKLNVNLPVLGKHLS